MSFAVYGLREARRLVSRLSRNVHRETSAFAKGYRCALRDADRVIRKSIDEAIDKIESPNAEH